MDVQLEELALAPHKETAWGYLAGQALVAQEGPGDGWVNLWPE